MTRSNTKSCPAAYLHRRALFFLNLADVLRMKSHEVEDASERLRLERQAEEADEAYQGFCKALIVVRAESIQGAYAQLVQVAMAIDEIKVDLADEIEAHGNGET